MKRYHDEVFKPSEGSSPSSVGGALHAATGLNSDLVGGALRAATLPHSADLRRHRISLPLHTYHITKRLDASIVCEIDLARCGEILVDALVHQRNQHGCRLFAFVIMPDHVHWLFAVPEKAILSERVKVAFNWVALQINKVYGRRGRLWQDGYYDHLVRENGTVSGLIRYIEANPVRKELCVTAEAWEWSSACLRWKQCLDREWLSFHRFE